jgi:hypothetical protein
MTIIEALEIAIKLLDNELTFETEKASEILKKIKSVSNTSTEFLPYWVNWRSFYIEVGLMYYENKPKYNEEYQMFTENTGRKSHDAFVLYEEDLRERTKP